MHTFDVPVRMLRSDKPVGRWSLDELTDSSEVRAMAYSAMSAEGFEVQRICERMQLRPEASATQSDRYPHVHQLLFWQAAESVSGDPDIGLRICRSLPLLRAGVMSYLMLSSPSIRHAVLALAECSHLISDGLELKIDESGAEASLQINASPLSSPHMRHTEICMAYTMMKFLSVGMSQPIKPVGVAFQCKPIAPLAEYESVFGCPVVLARVEN
ncbi:AraC family transcriptional regulator ligand-binding domain-containing protein [Hydrocarboniphaga effusa]|uniref:AraC family transcriptional regulator ligand-binding domain-containing protein n=1 Tax=Hydrocarboniphaga effusa TaxID=243629 RepID=UPI003BAC66F6